MVLCEPGIHWNRPAPMDMLGWHDLRSLARESAGMDSYRNSLTPTLATTRTNVTRNVLRGALMGGRFFEPIGQRPRRAYSAIDGRCAMAARQRSRCGCCSSGLTLTTRAKSTATTAVMSATLN